MLCFQNHAILVLLLIDLLTQTTPGGVAADENSLESKRDACLKLCKRLNSNSIADDIDCVKNCLTTRKKRGTGFSQSVIAECPKHKLRQEYLGNIVNISVDFQPRTQNETIVAWIANITWDAMYINSSLYAADIWQGFKILWVKNTAGSGKTNCLFNYKNVTWRTIEFGTSKSEYPIYVQVVFYPASEKDNTLEMKTFSPSGISFTPSSASSASSTLQPLTTTTHTIKPSIYITPQTDAKRYNPTNEPTNTGYIIGAVGAGAVMGLVALAVLVILHRKKRRPTPLPTPDRQNFKYDTSIIFSQSDQKFVTKKLIPFLEKENNFKCFVHFRNWEIGKDLHENMAYTIYNCRKIIAVISKHFLESNYCQTELSMALHRVHSYQDSSLIVINLGVPVQLLPDALKSRTFLDFTSSKEKKTWKTRLGRQISAEESGDNARASSCNMKAVYGTENCRGTIQQPFSCEEEEDTSDYNEATNHFTRLSSEGSTDTDRLRRYEQEFSVEDADQNGSCSGLTLSSFSITTIDENQESVIQEHFENEITFSVSQIESESDECWARRFQSQINAEEILRENYLEKDCDTAEEFNSKMTKQNVNNNQDTLVTATISRNAYTQIIEDCSMGSAV